MVGAAIALFLLIFRPYPSDKTPEGAYVRIARAVGEGRLQKAFAYLETEAQWSAYTILKSRKKACEHIREDYPEPERSRLLRKYEPDANAEDGADVFARIAIERGWDAQLRRDMSGAANVEIEGERASVTTVRGTRYPFRRRENGIWGLTIFTADLVDESKRAVRDLEVIEQGAADYRRTKQQRQSAENNAAAKP